MACNISDIEDIPTIPLYYQHVWEWFITLNQSRSGGRNAPLVWHEILAYLTLMGIDYSRDEIEALKVFDSLYLDAVTSEDYKQ